MLLEQRHLSSWLSWFYAIPSCTYHQVAFNMRRCEVFKVVHSAVFNWLDMVNMYLVMIIGQWVATDTTVSIKFINQRRKMLSNTATNTISIRLVSLRFIRVVLAPLSSIVSNGVGIVLLVFLHSTCLSHLLTSWRTSLARRATSSRDSVLGMAVLKLFSAYNTFFLFARTIITTLFVLSFLYRWVSGSSRPSSFFFLLPKMGIGGHSLGFIVRVVLAPLNKIFGFLIRAEPFVTGFTALFRARQSRARTDSRPASIVARLKGIRALRALLNHGKFLSLRGAFQRAFDAGQGATPTRGSMKGCA